ncbi:hypothetical protein BK128_09605 [Viridibacillus sp. FSL H7-0596]|uniref:hypothetical protein n=1 Tax=Viridibacillus sp. FSL H7-0596 TaxID=1928923 RepID=UPI00096D83C2|nr:hypothetical protein [Viridibacillus sp. FSL H7-0596]OMC86911.1 hypothetical protein BK128_09605 [Viridibacillus sp. FSL H7-0596]
MSGWHSKRCRKVVKAYTEFGLKKKIKDNETRGWKQLGEIKTENSNSGAYAALMEMEIERKVKHA